MSDQQKMIVLIFLLLGMLPTLVGCENGKMLQLFVLEHEDISLLTMESTTVDQFNISTFVYKTIDDQQMKLDIVEPFTETYASSPVIVYIHGGGYVSGSKERAYQGDFITDINYYFLHHGYTLVSIDYTLANREQGTGIQNAVIDVKDALKWLRMNANVLGIDPNNIGLFGTSAGGGLATLAGYSESDDFKGNALLSEFSAEVNYIINFYGGDTRMLVDMVDSYNTKEDLSATALKYLTENSFKLNINENASLDSVKYGIRSLSCLTYVDSMDPPTLTLHGSSDKTVLIDQSIRLHDMLNKNDVSNSFYRLEGYGHGFQQLTEEEKVFYLAIIFSFAEDYYRN